MTIWTPTISAEAEPKYQALVDALLRDVEAGVLQPGTRLPPQRELAERLGVAIGTVGRAYAVAEQRGLVSGEVGRGTFVRGPEPGTVLELPLSALVDRPPDWSATTHVLPIASVVRLAAALGAGLDRGWFVGLGGQRFELGSGLSAPVRAALPRYVAHVERRLYGAEAEREDSRA